MCRAQIAANAVAGIVPKGHRAQYGSALLKGWENRDLAMVRQISIVLLSIGTVSAAGTITGCSYTGPSDLEKGQSMGNKTIEEVQEGHTDEWMAIPGIVGAAIGLSEGKGCIRIFTSSNPQQLRDKIPSMVEGYPVIIEQTGEFRALEQQ